MSWVLLLISTALFDDYSAAIVSTHSTQEICETVRDDREKNRPHFGTYACFYYPDLDQSHNTGEQPK